MNVRTRFLGRVHRPGRLAPTPGADRGRVLVLAAAAVILATVTAAALPASAGAHVGPASGTKVVDGCTVVLHPTGVHFTDCPGKDLSAANFSGLDLQFANFSKSDFVPPCAGVPGGAFCTGTDFDHADLDHADVKKAVFASCCGTASAPAFASASLSGANMQQINASDATIGDFTSLDLRDADLSGANVLGGFSRSDLTGANLSKAQVWGLLGGGGFAHSVLGATNFTDAYVGELTFDGARLSARTNFDGSEIQYSDFTGTILVPTDSTVPASSPSGAVATWNEPKALPGASPGACSPASGSHFATGVTKVQCTINGGRGLPNWGGPNTATATFVVTVK